MKTKIAMFLVVVSTQASCIDDTETDPETIIVEVPEDPPPDPVSTEVVVDVRASQVTGEFTLEGGFFPNSIYESGSMFLREMTTGDPVLLGQTYADDYSLMMIHGSYDSLYQHGSGNDVPVNEIAVIEQNLEVDADRTIDIGVTMVSVRPQFTLNGAAFPQHAYIRAEFFLQPAGSEQQIFLGDSNVVSNQPVNVVAGTYHVLYKHIQGDQLPGNRAARVMSDVVIDGDRVVDVDVVTRDVRTGFLLNGGPFPLNQYDHGEFYLTNPTTGDEVFLGESYDAPSTILVVSGTYDAQYRNVNGTQTPLNKRKVLQRGVDLTNGGALTLDVPTITFGINHTLNGAPFPVSEYADGNLFLVDPETGNASMLGNTHGTISDLEVIPGTYDIAYEVETPGDVPLNGRTVVVSDLEIVSDTTQNLDIVAHGVTSAVTLNSEAFPVNQYDSGNILLRSATSSEDLQVAPTYDQSESILVLPGIYDVIYRCSNCLELPFNTNLTLIDGQEINDDTVLVADIRTVRLDVSATLNGGAFPNSLYESGKIWGGIEPGDAIEMTPTYLSTEDVIVAEGLYTFFYQHQNGEQVPVNNWAEVGEKQFVVPSN